jgi:hypothetical protein
LEGRRLLNSMTGGDSGIFWMDVGSWWIKHGQPNQSKAWFALADPGRLWILLLRVFFSKIGYTSKSFKITISIAKTRLLYISIPNFNYFQTFPCCGKPPTSRSHCCEMNPSATVWQERVFLKRTLRFWDRAWERGDDTNRPHVSGLKPPARKLRFKCLGNCNELLYIYTYICWWLLKHIIFRLKRWNLFRHSRIRLTHLSETFFLDPASERRLHNVSFPIGHDRTVQIELKSFWQPEAWQEAKGMNAISKTREMTWVVGNV